MSLQLDGRFPSLVLSPEGQRARILELLATLLLDSAAEHQPVFIVVEDLHWADPSTLAVLGLLLDQTPTSQILALLSFRPEFRPPWASRAHVTQVMLNRLTRRLAGEMVDGLTSGRSLPEDVLSQVASKSDGVPLFVEELTRMVLESDLVMEAGDHYELTRPLPPLAIPTTLQDSLTARLDRLGGVREVAQFGAVLGREFSYALMQDVSPLDEETLRLRLQRLVDTEFLYQRGLPTDAVYTFKHALIQDAAYESLLRSTRQQYHQQVARSLEARFPEVVETQPEMVAHHYTEAGLSEQAVPYWQFAGERALKAYAHEEAIGHFQRGLAAGNIPLVAQETARNPVAAALLFGLGQAQAGTLPRDQLEGAITTLGRGFEYYLQMGDVTNAVAIAELGFPNLPGMRLGRGRIISKALEMVRPDSHDAGRLLSQFGLLLGIDDGIYEKGKDALERSLTIARREDDTVLESVASLNMALLNNFHLNCHDTLAGCQRSIAAAQLNDDVRSEMLGHYYIGMTVPMIGDLDALREHAAATVPLVERLRDQFWITSSFWVNEMAARLAGDWESALDFSDRGLSISPRDTRLLTTRTLMEYQLGNFDAGQDYLQKLLNVMEAAQAGPNIENAGPAVVLPLVNWIVGVDDWGTIAHTAANNVVSSDHATPYYSMMDRAGLAFIAAFRQDSIVSKAHYQAILPLKGLAVPQGYAAGDRLLGLLSQTMGSLNQAAGHFEDSMAFCRKAGYRPELAWTCCDYADVLSNRNNEGDRTKAMSVLDESLAISSELGMRPLTERVISRRELLEA